MFCPNHPDTPADQTCASCAKNFCRDCVVEIGGQPYCAACKEELVRDLKSGVSSREIGPLASRMSRFAAQLIDGFVVGMIGVVFILLPILAIGANHPDAIVATMIVGYVLFFIAAIFYEWKMVAATGQTLGKRALGIEVVADDGGPIGEHAWKRPVFRYVFTIMSCLGLIDPLMIFTERNRTLHDRIAKTLVIRSRR